MKTATSPFQYALSTGCECISHALQALWEKDPDATIISIDGIGAFNSMGHFQGIYGRMRKDQCMILTKEKEENKGIQ